MAINVLHLSSICFLLLGFFILDAHTTDNRIVGGRPALEGEFPYQVSLRRSYNDKHFCGGSIITKDVILTAAHCMYYQWGGVLPPIVVSVVAGQLNITIKEDTVYRNASEIIVHPLFNKTSMENDIALVKLSESLPLTQFISTVRLALYDAHAKECIVSGWGVIEFESKLPTESLLATTVWRITNAKCYEMYGNETITESMLCAHDEAGEHDACQGDSGGPLVCGGQLYGVISTGEGCASKQFPGIYASVPYLHTWISQHVDLGDISTSTNPSTIEETTPSIKTPATTTEEPSKDVVRPGTIVQGDNLVKELPTTAGPSILEREKQWFKELFSHNLATTTMHNVFIVICTALTISYLGL